MKLNKFFLVGMVALGLIACNSEDGIDLQGQAESTVSVKVAPSSNGPTVRAVGDLTGNGISAIGLAAESEIKFLEVYLFDDILGTVAGYKSAGVVGTETSVSEVKGITTTSGPKTMIVVANANIGGVTSKAILLAKTKNLPVVIANGLPMTGMTTTPVVVKPGQNYYGHALPTGTTADNYIAVGVPLKVYRVNARVAIIGATIDLTGAPVEQANFFDALSGVEVAMFNVPKTTKLFGDPLAMNGDYLHGELWPSTSNTYTPGAVEGTFKNAVTFPILVGAAPFYYVNENTAATQGQMMIVLRAKPMKGGVAVQAEGLYTTGGYTYYPVWINATDAKYTYTGDNTGDSKIRRNTQYNISITIKGIGNPTIDPPAQSFLDVLVSVENWLVINQGVVWGTPVVPAP